MSSFVLVHVSNIYDHVILYNLLSLKSNRLLPLDEDPLHSIAASSRLWSGTRDAEGI
jgi:hypothetical protein